MRVVFPVLIGEATPRIVNAGGRAGGRAGRQAVDVFFFFPFWASEGDGECEGGSP